VGEGKRSRSDPELVRKIEGGLQELEETVCWLELLVDLSILDEDQGRELLSVSPL